MKLGNVDLEYTGGNIVITAPVGSMLKPALEKIRADIASGAIDPIKGTDLDAIMLNKVLDALEGAI